MTKIICIVQIHQLIYKCELCPILHICSTTPFHRQPTHTHAQVYCSQHSKWQTSLQPPHHFSRGFAPFDRKCSSKSLHHKLTLPVSTGLIIFFIWCFQDPLDPVEACQGPRGVITQYQIRFQSGSTVNTENVNIARCTAGRCSHTFQPPSNLPSSFDSVSVAAENVVGQGAAAKCTAQSISEWRC